MRKKLFFTIFFLFSIMFIAFSEPVSSFVVVKPSCITVDLASQAYKAHRTNSTWSAGTSDSNTAASNGYYYDNQILAVIGIEHVKDKGLPVTITLELMSQEWSYILDDRYKRPFGVDMFARGSTEIGLDGHDIEGYSRHLGNQSNHSTSNTVILPVDIVRNHDVIWWDVCLVMDPAVNTTTDSVTTNGTTYNLTPSDSYYNAILQVTISCGDLEDSYALYLQGHYKSTLTNTQTGTQLMVSVQKLSTANTLDITEMFNSKTSQSVATYGFTTTEKITDDDSGTVSVFLSSSSNGLASTSEFTLRRVLPNSQVSVRDTVFNSIPFRAHISSTNGSKANDGTTRVSTFDGTDYFGNPNTLNNQIVVRARMYNDHKNNSYAIWADTGEISVSFVDTRAVTQGTMEPRQAIDINTLVSGQYTANIYVHFVTDGL